ncbi:LUD domain-containing protein [Kitasatospora paracochleata]|uniref:L-lactate dehydrogenase complex protein LldG n=1 Tax=Kitasatospora paracochleata TaxID=58354 RepID=A0ABT1IWJ1_9ACTN|nr:LUD domain-containing protein [Kitasatospora paracochleata]MCP2309516.1 L-lactate dehydrogenase complex protein LldG [Kitasatospora paracochleata]
MSTRDTILGRARAALGDVPPAERPEEAPIPRGYRRSHADVPLVELFAERVADYRATVTVAPEHQAARTVGRLLADRGLTRAVVPDGFPDAWLPGGTFTRLGDAPPRTPAELDGIGAVLSTCAVAIAVTGTIVLDAGPGQGRRALTLLPDYHLCVVRAEQIAGDVPEAIALLDPTRPLTFVSGPSATSDIELDRVEGVHGPRTLDVIILTSTEEA